MLTSFAIDEDALPHLEGEQRPQALAVIASACKVFLDEAFDSVSLEQPAVERAAAGDVFVEQVTPWSANPRARRSRDRSRRSGERYHAPGRRDR